MPDKLEDSIIAGKLLESAFISAAHKTTVGGLFASVYGWLTHTGSAIFIGIVITILGFVVNCYFQKKRARREHILWKQTLEANMQANIKAEARKEELHQARLAAIRMGIPEKNHE